MEINSYLNSFFLRFFEKEYNNLLLDRSYVLDRESIITYVKNAISIPLSAYFDWLRSRKPFVSLDSSSVPQFSSLAMCTSSLCQIMSRHDEKGLTNTELGKILQDDGVCRTLVADTKFGENHGKTAELLGLVYRIKRYRYLSCIGYVFNELALEEREKLLCRLFVRSPLFEFLFPLIDERPCSMRDILDFLSDSTYKRRKPNLRVLFQLISNEIDPDDHHLIDNILL